MTRKKEALIAASTKTVDTADFMRLIESWDPCERPVHCSNCINAIVTGDGIHHPSVHCAKGYGRTISIWQLTRNQRPFGFRNAAECPDFTSMDDDTEKPATI